MLQVLAVLVGLVAGFAGARAVRRPSGAARAASAGRSVGAAVGVRRDLDLPHLQRSTLSEMVRHVRGDVVPERFVVHLHPADAATVDEAPGFFRQGLEEAMAAAGRDHRWSMPGRIRIDVETDPSRTRGAPGVTADRPAAPAPPPTRAEPPRPAVARVPAPPSGGAALVTATGTRHDLGDGPVTLGRGRDNTIVVADDRASRRHATLSVRAGTWSVRDDGSSNGTRVNGRQVGPHRAVPLSDGDVIAIGPVEYTFRVPRP